MPATPSIDHEFIDNLIHPTTHDFCSHCGNQLPGNSMSQVCANCEVRLPKPAAVTPRNPLPIRCHSCGLNLSDVAADERCPKCGTACADSMSFANRGPPSQLALAGALAWPLALLTVSVLASLSMGSRDNYLYIGGISLALIANVVNLPIVSSIITRKHIPKYRRGRAITNMYSLGVLVGLAWTFSLLITVLLFVAILLGVLVVTLVFGACFMTRG